MEKIKFDKLTLVWKEEEVWLMSGTPKLETLYNGIDMWMTDGIVLGKVNIDITSAGLMSEVSNVEFKIRLSTQKLPEGENAIYFPELWIVRTECDKFSLHTYKPELRESIQNRVKWDSFPIIGTIDNCCDMLYDLPCNEPVQIVTEDAPEEVTYWMGRDKNGEVYMYAKKPKKGAESWYSDFQYCHVGGLEKESFPDVTWDDEEPVEVVITPKKRNHNPEHITIGLNYEKYV